MRNNIIAAVVISFIIVGAMWGIGNLLNPPPQDNANRGNGILLVAENNAFNETNPDIGIKVNDPKEITILNKDFVRHDFIVNQTGITGINTSILFSDQHFKAYLVAQQPGVYEYFCDLHPTMRGKIVATA
jgi:plastocyanin